MHVIVRPLESCDVCDILDNHEDYHMTIQCYQSGLPFTNHMPRKAWLRTRAPYPWVTLVWLTPPMLRLLLFKSARDATIFENHLNLVLIVSIV